MLASGELGQHNGLPCTIIVSTTLKELESGCGQAVTAGGTLLPMTDVIRMASHSYHYLVIFDRHRNPALPGPQQAHRVARAAHRHMVSFEHRFAKVASSDLRQG